MFIGGLIFAGLGLLLVLISFADAILALRYIYTGTKTWGRIIGTKPKVGDVGGLCPVISFTTAAGQTVEFKSVDSCTAQDVGKDIEVVYLQSNPKNAETAAHAEMKKVMSNIGTLSLGALFVVLGLGLMFLKSFIRHWVNS